MIVGQLFKRIFTRKVSVTRPSRAEIVIFDSYSERHFRPLLPPVTVSVIDGALKNVNLWIFLHSLRYGRPSLLTYTWSFVRLARASLVVTTIDNSPIIYQIKSKLPEVKVCVVQNGRRGTFGVTEDNSFLSELRKYEKYGPNCADYYICFGTTEIMQFGNLIQAKFVPVGSIKNNYFCNHPAPRQDPVMSFVSSFPNFDYLPKASVESEETYLFSGNHPITHLEYFKAEAEVAKFLVEYCKNHGIRFQVVGKRSSKSHLEEAFFRRAAPGQWKFIPNDTERTSYDVLHRSKFVASVDSTLAYEMFGLGIRTAFFTIRSEFFKSTGSLCTKFGYPQVVDDSGPMWTNISEIGELERVTNFVVKSTDYEWEEAWSHYAPIVMSQDRLNSKLGAIISNSVGKDGPSQTEILSRVTEIYG